MTAPSAEFSNVLRTENELLKRAFLYLKLDPCGVSHPRPGNLEIENRQLRHLLEWACAYRACPDRAKLEKQGYEFPPVEPDFEPDTDWLLFTRWMEGKPLTWSLAAEVENLGQIDRMSACEILERRDRIRRLLAERGIIVELAKGLPPLLALKYLVATLRRRRFEYLAPGAALHLTACTGYCPDCFQRPWCEVGAKDRWPEDEEAVRMVYPADVESST